MQEAPQSGAVRPISSYYDGMGRQIQSKSETQDGLKHTVVDTKYDGLGQTVWQGQPRDVTNTAGDPAFWNYATPNWSTINKTITTYDGVGRPLTVQEPNNTSTTMAYLLNTADGRRVARVTDAKGHRTERESDMLGRLIAVKEYSGESAPYSLYSTTTYAYSPLDLLTTVTDGYGKQTTMQYDSLGRKTQMTDLTMGLWQYGYDVNGNLTTQTDARGQTITFTYDALNRLTGKSWPSYGNNPGETLNYFYDQTTGYTNGKGQRTSMTRFEGGTRTSLVQWQYDARGQTTSTTYTFDNQPGRTQSQQYDSAGRVTSMTYPTGEAVQYTYDAGWRQTSLCSTTYSLCYASNASYTALDQPSSFTLGNNLTQQYSYDSLMQRLTSIQVGSGGSVFNRGYDYDPVGNVQTITGSPTVGTQTFQYDHRDRLTTWTATGINESYSYDLVGNITFKGGSYYYDYNHSAGAGGPYALRNGGYSYDANGNSTSEQIYSDQRTFVWNTENQPVSIGFQGTIEYYTYDADNARVKKVRNGTSTYYIGGMYEEDVTGATA